MKYLFKIFLLLVYTSIQAQEKNNDQAISRAYNPTELNTRQESYELKLSSGLTKTLKYDGTFESLNPSVISQISEINMENKQFIHLVEDNYSNYYLFNLSILEDNFEKIYFYKGIVKYNLFIQIEHGLPSNLSWIIADKKENVNSVMARLKDLLIQTKTVSKSMNDAAKQIWITNNIN